MSLGRAVYHGGTLLMVVVVSVAVTAGSTSVLVARKACTAEVTDPCCGSAVRWVT